ncbi:MAG TPA: acetate kinase [Symbiobacteriaceae bacterium]|nr:acetate kinase [Symbiobacteriaceae bacterium]
MMVLVLNCGSSSLKYQLLNMETEEMLATGLVQRIGMEDAMFEYKVPGGKEIKEVTSILDHTAGVRKTLAALTNPEYGVVKSMDEITAVGHRVVHGGEAFTGSVLITDEVKSTMRALIDLAPLHNPPNLVGIAAAEAALPGKPQVGVFDTAFHQTMPRTAFLYALPYAMYKRHKVRRYGFHGTSHRYVSERLAANLGKPLTELKVITCHLGNGSSACAIMGGKSVDTSMGFTPLEGLIMGTRSGDLDPGVLQYIMSREDLTMQEVQSMLNKHSGMKGISGISSDARQIEEEMAKGDVRAQETFDMVEYRLRKYIGAYAAAMNGVDAIIFTGGIGENSATLRGAVCRNLTYLGLELDETVNNTRSKNERTISTPNSKVQVWVIPTNEELVIARDTVEVVKGLNK